MTEQPSNPSKGEMGKWSNGVLGSSRSLEHTAAISLECNTEGGAASGQPNWFKSILISVYLLECAWLRRLHHIVDRMESVSASLVRRVCVRIQC